MSWHHPLSFPKSDLFPHLSREILPLSIPSYVLMEIKSNCNHQLQPVLPSLATRLLIAGGDFPFLHSYQGVQPAGIIVLYLTVLELRITAVLRVTLAASSSFPFFLQVTWHQDFRVGRKLRDHHLLRDRRNGIGLRYPGRHTPGEPQSSSQLLFLPGTAG